MIVSFEHNFIFIKTQKTGSTSVEIALTPFCGAMDIITPMSLADEQSRLQDGVVQARNYARDKATEMAFRLAVLSGNEVTAGEISSSLRTGGSFFNHMPAAVAKPMLPAAFWGKAFKFTVQRHPYEKAVSWAYFRLQNNKAPPTDFPRYLDEAVRLLPIDESRLYTIDGRSVVDRVIRQEHLAADLNDVALHLGFGPLGDLPRAKSGSRLDRRPAREILSTEQQQLIFSRARSIFEECGYEQ
jgi:hypothetical protein